MFAIRTLPLLFLGMASSALADERDAPTNWALKPLARPPVPKNVAHPIDAFVRAKLGSLVPSPEADRRTLIRRLYFDLIGLPPTPEAVNAFAHDAANDAYERLVDELLASPRYGERWARHWIDAAHFAETHGHDQDRVRPNAWPYRDYLIASLNADKPYARFVQEQVAGDALFPDDPQATVALGFLAAGPWDESSLRDIREDTVDRQIGRYLDRDDVVSTVMSTFASTTVHCARCHDHKFDPIPQEDYYALQAVFAGVERANRVYDPDPRVHHRRQMLLRQRRALDRRDPALLALFNDPATQAQVAAWELAMSTVSARWTTLQPLQAVSSEGATLTVQNDGSVISSGSCPDRDVYTISARSSGMGVTAIRLEVLSDNALPQNGPGRRENGNFHLSEFALLSAPEPGGTAEAVCLKNPSADFNQADWTISHAIDGDEKTAWGVFPSVGKSHHAIFELAGQRHIPAGATLTFILKQLHGRGHLIGRMRLSSTNAALPVRANTFPDHIVAVLARPPASRGEKERRELFEFWLRDEIERGLSELPAPQLVYAAANDFAPDGNHVAPKEARPVHVLKRGDVGKPGELALAGALSCVHTLPSRFALADPADESSRRAALARWLSDAENPLTWRSIVNRLWHHHFGCGLVDTPNDLGKMGGKPSHPELLDWLATWFRDEGGSWKKLHRLIVTSATYRQSTHGVAENAIVDADNRLLWRMNRQRLDAECVRDAILQISGSLDLRMGGPSDQLFDMKPGNHVTPLINYSNFDVDSAAGRRRSIYRFLFRTLPDPFMDALDCPAGDQLTGARNASVTVQQALALWNSAFTARYAEHFAARVEHASPELDKQVAAACELALGRLPNASEAQQFANYARVHGLANLCRVIFNSNEFLFVN